MCVFMYIHIIRRPNGTY